MKIGFIGLGIMGKPMVNNLIKAGHEVVVYDIVKENVDMAVKNGAVAVNSCKELATSVMCVITMLPNSPHVKEAVCGKDGVLDGAKEGCILIDMSSIAPKASIEIEAECRKKGVKMIDAPVSGGEPKAIDGTLSIMVGGDDSVFKEVESILLTMGANAVLCGGIGAGNTTKLANQIIVASNIAAVAESLMLAKKAGVDPQLVFEAIRGGLAGSAILNAKAPMMITGNFQPGFKIDLHIKDLNNALDTGEEFNSPTPLTTMTIDMMKHLAEGGFGQCDHSALLKYYEEITGVVLSGDSQENRRF